MILPKIDVSDIVALLKSGGKELGGLLLPKELLREWDNLIRILDGELCPMLKRGANMQEIQGVAKSFARSAQALSWGISEVLTFVPGPVGIIVSLARAIVLFSTNNIAGGLAELAGCVFPFKVNGKMVVVTGELSGKFMSNFNKMVNKNPELKTAFKEMSSATKVSQSGVTNISQVNTRSISPNSIFDNAGAQSRRSVSSNRIAPKIQPKRVDERYGIGNFGGLTINPWRKI